MRDLFRSIDWHTTRTLPNAFGCNSLPSIAAMIGQRDHNAPSLLINSDVLLAQQPKQPEPNTFQVGIVSDHDPGSTQLTLRNYGIDAFWLLPDVTLPDAGFVIGKPAWDYWLVHAMHTQGYPISPDKSPIYLHERHERSWTENDYATGSSLLTQATGLEKRQATEFILHMTSRTRNENTAGNY
mgnify:CR=1 FL=1